MSADFSTIGLIGKQGDAKVGESLRLLVPFLQARGRRVLADKSTAHLAADLNLEVVNRAALATQCDLAITVGGDGTLLNVARSFGDAGIPLVGVNLGRLGFLADLPREEMLPLLEAILQGQYVLEERTRLHATIERDGQAIESAIALNEVVVHKWNMARMIEYAAYVDHRFVTTQRSDGLIIATPTGSTAYALSGGGPILHPSLHAVVLVPICPHTLSNRPIVVPDDQSIGVVITECHGDHAQMTCDGQMNFNLRAGDRVHVKKHAFPLRLIHPQRHDHYEILRAKLRWGEKL